MPVDRELRGVLLVDIDEPGSIFLNGHIQKLSADSFPEIFGFHEQHLYFAGFNPDESDQVAAVVGDC